MPFEQRLHPASIAFEFGKHLRNFALPGLLVLVTAGRASDSASRDVDYVPGDWQVWLMLLLVPNALASIARYLSFRLSFEDTELVIRSGVLFKSERHVPYARIQNLDGVQNVLHRLLGVVQVRAETGGGREPEATINVLSVAAFHDMRRRVFERRARIGEAEGHAHEPGSQNLGSAAAQNQNSPNLIPSRGLTHPELVHGRALPAQNRPDLAPVQELLHLDPRELLMCGLIENRGLLVIGTGYGILWETGALDRVWGRIFGEDTYGRGVFRDVFGAIFNENRLTFDHIALALAALAGLLLVVRLVSVLWTFVRLYDFRLGRAGDDLRTEFGLFTRVTTTIPLHRIQTLTIRDAPLHRITKRVSVRVETAGGSRGGTGSREREWLAPIVRRTALPSLLREVIPELDIDALDWQRVHPRAFRRAITPGLLAAFLVTAVTAGLLGWWAVSVLTLTVAWSIFATRQRIRHLAWAMSNDVVALRSGWILRQLTVARVAKLQVVTVYESPFDRRAAMARVRVDTAGAQPSSHRVDIPYLPRATAMALGDSLAALAARRSFRW